MNNTYLATLHGPTPCIHGLHLIYLWKSFRELDQAYFIKYA